MFVKKISIIGFFVQEQWDVICLYSVYGGFDQFFIYIKQQRCVIVVCCYVVLFVFGFVQEGVVQFSDIIGILADVEVDIFIGRGRKGVQLLVFVNGVVEVYDVCIIVVVFQFYLCRYCEFVMGESWVVFGESYIVCFVEGN